MSDSSFETLADLDQKDFASVSLFYRDYPQEDTFTVLLQTDPLFPPSTGSSAAGIQTSPKISRKDLTCNYDYYY